MTGMKRITISLPSTIDEKILDLRKTDKFIRCSYSEIVRELIKVGVLKMLQDEAGDSA